MTLDQRLTDLYSWRRNERAYLQIIETKYLALQEQLRELDQQREEGQQRLAQFETKEKSLVLEEVKKSADLLLQRSQLYDPVEEKPPQSRPEEEVLISSQQERARV